GAPRFVGGVDGWKNVGPWWEVDVSAVTAPGRYALRWRIEGSDAGGQSEGFSIGDTLFGPALVSDLLFHIKSQRSSGIWDAADRRAPRFGGGERRDVSGGW